MKTSIVFQGNFPKSNVSCTYMKTSSRKIDPVIEEKVQHFWERKVADAQKAGKKVGDQPVHRLENVSIKNGTCTLAFSAVPFRTILGIKNFIQDIEHKGEEYLTKTTFSTIFVETRDGEFLFGEKSNHYVTTRRYSYIGGVFNRDDDPSGKTDLFASASQEVQEELGVSESDFKIFNLLGASSNNFGNIGFIFHCVLKLTKAEVIQKFETNNDLELKSLFFTQKKDIRDISINKIGKEPEVVDIFFNQHQ